MDILWTLYLGLLMTSVIAYLFQGKYNTLRAKIDFVVSLITWLGLFGYVTETEMLTPIVWKTVFIIAILWDIIFTLFLNDYEYEYIQKDNGQTMRKRTYGKKETLPLWAKIFGLVMIAPLYYGLYQYAF
ncbi:hypothetical protein ACFFJY_20240 [Fictibacillus aquaticus]|uniref:Uncharacterized protein n=1 Tax=Fictibacillus aquaticus TaxID=2021314 RepID=A0A235F4U5_9BACL|nr:hypothetical protein [Fictibacillus aquaticus]OYD56234.1 hypothetical protein CGZ90_18590 [Fictibacillus aquaticus]